MRKEKEPVYLTSISLVREREYDYNKTPLSDAEKAYGFIKPLAAGRDKEMFVTVALDSRLYPTAVDITAVGGVNACSVRPGDIFKPALLSNGVSVICFHNHPSGDPEPSKEDRTFTKVIKTAGDILGIKLTDHIIAGEDSFYSFAEEGEI